MPFFNIQMIARAASVALACLLLLTNPVPSQGQGSAGATPTEAGSAAILVLGDSLSAEYGLRRGSGWVALLQEEFDQGRLPAPAFKPLKPRLVNASISGETTAGGRARIAELLARHRPALVIIELGGNDALRGLDQSMTERNLREMVQMSRQARASVLLVGMQIPPNFGKAYADRFRDGFVKVAESEKAALLPFLLEGVADRADWFQADRIHPNELAQPRMMRNVREALLPLLQAPQARSRR